MPTISAKSLSAVLISFSIGIVFIFSGISKIPTLEQFGWTIVETTFLNWTLAEWSARILIGLELYLGLLFVSNLQLRRLTIPFSILLLVLFSIYLLVVMRMYGNEGNCGCFGEVMPMSPKASIIKNILLLVAIIFLRMIHSSWSFRYMKPTLIITLLACISIPIILSPPESIYIKEHEPLMAEPIPLSILYYSDKNLPPSIELRKGKHVLLFLSLTCTYCKKAAKRLKIMKQKHPELPFYAIMNGDSSDLKPFLLETTMDNIPYTLFKGPEQFALMNGGFSLPTIKWVKDTITQRESNYLSINENEILEWMKLH